MVIKINSGNRWYTERSSRIKSIVYILVAVVFSPIWVPFYLMAWLGYVLLEIGEKVTSFFDWTLEKILGKVIPQLEDKRMK